MKLIHPLDVATVAPQPLWASLADQLDAAPITGSPDQMRERFAALIGPGPSGLPREVGGVPCVCHGEGPPVVWLHGGGYVFGSPETHARAARALARLAQVTVILPAYRRAPEHPWPAPFEDACAVLDALPGRVALVGDSAGGHLALTLARQRPGRLYGLALISPNTDRTGLSTTRVRNSDRDLLNSDGDDAALARLAMPDLAATHSDASPILANLSDLPRTFVTASCREVLYDDTLLLLRALARDGHTAVEADLTSAPWHMWPLWPDALLDARVTLSRIAGFLKTAAIPGLRGTSF